MFRSILITSVLFLSLGVAATAATPTLTASWNAVITDTNGNALTSAVSYNVYAGAKASEALANAAPIAATTLAIPATPGQQTCVQVTAVSNGIESMRSVEVCATASFPAPSAPAGVTLK